LIPTSGRVRYNHGMKRFRFSIRRLLLLVTLGVMLVAMYFAFNNFLRNPEHARIQADIDKWTGLKAKAMNVLSGVESGNKEWAEYSVRQANSQIPTLEQELRDADLRYEQSQRN
jgi:hypothetical protein